MKLSFILPMLKSILGKKAYLSQYKFQKNDQVIYFQEMVHIAPSKVYEDVNKSIKTFLQTYPEGKIYLEGIHGDEKDSQALNDKLMKVVGVKQPEGKYYMFIKELYKSIALITDLQAQDDKNYLKDIPEEKKVKADMSFTELYDKIKNCEESEEAKRVEFNPESEKVKELKQSKLLSFLLRHLLCAILLKKRDASLFNGEVGPFKEVGKIILNDRNQVILNFIKTSQDKQIFLTYGAAHLKEVKELLIKDGYSFESVKEIVYSK